MRAGLTARLLVAAGALVVIAFAAFIFLLLAMADVESSRNSVLDSQQEQAVAREIRNLLVDMESGQRGFIITGDETFLEPWEASRVALPGKLALLRQVSEDPGQQSRAAQLERDALAYVNKYAVPLVDAARRGDPTVRNRVASDGFTPMRALRQEVDTYSSTEGSLIVAEVAKAERNYRRATLIAVIGLGASVLVTVVSAAYVAQGVVRPVRRTAQMAQRLAGGDLTARVPETARAEVGVLERAFNSMAQSLQRNRSELTRLNDEQGALRRIATLVAHGQPSNEVFTAATREVGELLGAEMTRLIRFEADGGGTVAATWVRTGDPLPVGSRIPIDGIVAAPVRASGKPACMAEQSPPELPAGNYSAVGAPIMVGGMQWGAVTLLSLPERPLPEGSEARMAEFIDLVGTAVANAQDRADLVVSRARIVTAADDARRRLERDLHDGAQQRLVSLALQARMAQESVPAELVDLKGDLAELVAGLKDTSSELREISRGIPRILSEGGLAPALEALASRSVVPVNSSLAISQQLPDPVAVTAYYVVAEALTNVAKHAHGSEASVRAETKDGVLCLSIDDNGIGGADPYKGSGLVGLNDRVEAFGGHMVVHSPPGDGTSISVSIRFSSR
jgi:signal transduction histidine kinase